MTQLLDQAIKEVSKLPAPEQDALASILLAEMASEKRWTESLAKSQDLLAKLAEDAVNEYKVGKTQPL